MYVLLHNLIECECKKSKRKNDMLTLGLFKFVTASSDYKASITMNIHDAVVPSLTLMGLPRPLY
jgi:hypothetical protein